MSSGQFHALCGAILLSGAFTSDSQLLFIFAILNFLIAFFPTKHTND